MPLPRPPASDSSVPSRPRPSDTEAAVASASTAARMDSDAAVVAGATGDPGLLSMLGPGLVTGAADDDPSGIATYSQAGAQLGYQAGWTLLFTYPLMVGIQLASARIGRVTGRGLTENFSRWCPRGVVALLVLLLTVANVINLGADLNAMGASAAMVLPGHPGLWAVVFGGVSLLLQVFLPYRRYVRVLKWLTLSLFAYVGVAFVAHVDWRAALVGMVAPSLSFDRASVTTVVAILGTTISPYLFFWQAQQEVEEIHRVAGAHALRVVPHEASRQFRRLRLDTLVGMGFSNVVAFFMMVATAATLHAHGQHDIQTTQQAAEALRPIAGEAAFLLFAFGIVGTGLLALPVLAGSAADAVASYFHLRKGLDRPLAAARSFYAILALAMALGLAISLAGADPIKALYWSAVINAVISVPVMVAVMITATRASLMRHMVLHGLWKLLGWIATAAMAAAGLALLAVQWA